MSMYLLIYEDGEIQSSREAGADLTEAADDGILDLLDVSDPENPMRWWDSEWQPVDAVAK